MPRGGGAEGGAVVSKCMPRGGGAEGGAVVSACMPRGGGAEGGAEGGEGEAPPPPLAVLPLSRSCTEYTYRHVADGLGSNCWPLMVA